MTVATAVILLTDTQFGLWAGLAVDNTAETTATGAAYSPQAQNVAVAVKNTRNALIGVVVLVYALYWANRGGVAVEKGWRPRTAFVWRTFPKFVLGFIAVSAIATSGLLAKPAIASLGNLSKWAFLLCFAGVGLNFDPRARPRRCPAAGRGGARVAIHAFTKDTEELLGDAPTAVLG
jgi:uncharacterized membrane protein YadS